jgi:hypothetical protein
LEKVVRLLELARSTQMLFEWQAARGKMSLSDSVRPVFPTDRISQQ